MPRRFLGRIPRGLVETPHEVGLSFIFTLYGIVFLASGAAATPNYLDDALPQWQVIAWGLCLAVGGPLTLWGRFRYALRMESSGLVLQIAGLLIFSVTLLLAAPPSPGLYLICAVLGILAASGAVRVWVISRAVKGLLEIGQ